MYQPTMTDRHRRGRAASIVGLLLALGLVVAACGEDGGTAVAPPSTGPSATSDVPTSAGSATSVARGGPRWETVTTLTGAGPAEPPAFSILKDSIQWRARWKCDTGRLLITTDPPPRRPTPLVDSDCPGQAEGFAIVTGDVRLKIEASGPWEVTVDQQVDTPLLEPPFEGMDTAPVLRQGSFYPVEKEAKGTARIYRRADGSNILRLEDFEVSTNVDLFVWASEAAAPKTSVDAAAAPHVVLGNLRSTLGNQNYVLPADLALERVKSIVIWCEPIRTVYGAAALTP